MFTASTKQATSAVSFCTGPQRAGIQNRSHGVAKFEWKTASKSKQYNNCTDSEKLDAIVEQRQLQTGQAAKGVETGDGCELRQSLVIRASEVQRDGHDKSLSRGMGDGDSGRRSPRVRSVCVPPCSLMAGKPKEAGGRRGLRNVVQAHCAADGLVACEELGRIRHTPASCGSRTL